MPVRHPERAVERQIPRNRFQVTAQRAVSKPSVPLPKKRMKERNNGDSSHSSRQFHRRIHWIGHHEEGATGLLQIAIEKRLQDAIESTQNMLLRMEGGKEVGKRTGCTGQIREVMLQRCDTESITLNGDDRVEGEGDGRTERGSGIHAK